MKRLPIFLNQNLEEWRPMDGYYVYTYETVSRELVKNTTIDSVISSAYAKS